MEQCLPCFVDWKKNLLRSGRLYVELKVDSVREDRLMTWLDEVFSKPLECPGCGKVSIHMVEEDGRYYAKCSSCEVDLIIQAPKTFGLPDIYCFVKDWYRGVKYSFLVIRTRVTPELDVLDRFKGQGWSVREIAAELEITEQTVFDLMNTAVIEGLAIPKMIHGTMYWLVK